MQATETYIESEQRPEVRIPEEGTREMQDSCRPLFYRTAYRQLGNAADAEDAVQDALLSAYKHLDQFKGQAQMSLSTRPERYACLLIRTAIGTRYHFRSVSAAME
jgi:hypothetical protein